VQSAPGMTRHTRKLAPILFSLALVAPLAACEFEDPGVGESSQEIVNGHTRDPKVFAVGVTDAGCTVTMMDHDFGFTSAKCAAASRMVSIAGSDQKIRVVRTMASKGGSVRSIESQVVVVQLWRTLMPKFQRFIERAKVRAGDTLDCIAYDSAGQLRGGSFDVMDLNNGNAYLRGRPSLNLLPYEVADEGVGGYCQRDGSYDIAAILIKPTANGVAEARLLHGWDSGLEDMRYASAVADKGVAVRLLDASKKRFLDAPLLGGTRVVTTASPGTTQAFYLDEVRNPPGGGFDWYRLVDVATGQCQTVIPNSPAVVATPCDPSNTDQMFYSEYTSSTGQYRFHGTGGVIDASGSGNSQVTIAGASTAMTQQFKMWLTQY